MVHFEKDVPVVYAAGKGGADELSENLGDHQVLFGYLRTFLGYNFFFFLNMFHVCQCFHDCSAEKRTKYVAVRWVGSSITPTLRAKAMEQARIIATSYIKVFHIEILAHSQDEVTTSLVNTRLTKAAGANYGS